MKALFEQYRPQAWDDVIGQDVVVGQVRAIKKRGLGGRAYWITGLSGTGKTTIAYLLANELAGGLNIEELDASELTPARLMDVERGMRLIGFGKGGRVYIINEAHGLRRDTVRQLLVTLERLPSHAAFIFTTTQGGQTALFHGIDDAGALISRCIKLELEVEGLAQAFAKHVRRVARKEGLDGQAIGRYVELAEKCGCNMRAMFQAVEAGQVKKSCGLRVAGYESADPRPETRNCSVCGRPVHAKGLCKTHYARARKERRK